MYSETVDDSKEIVSSEHRRVAAHIEVKAVMTQWRRLVQAQYTPNTSSIENGIGDEAPILLEEQLAIFSCWEEKASFFVWNVPLRKQTCSSREPHILEDLSSPIWPFLMKNIKIKLGRKGRVDMGSVGERRWLCLKPVVWNLQRWSLLWDCVLAIQEDPPIMSNKHGNLSMIWTTWTSRWGKVH